MKADWTKKIKEDLSDYQEKAPEGLFEAVLAEREARKSPLLMRVLPYAGAPALAAIALVFFLRNVGNETATTPQPTLQITAEAEAIIPVEQELTAKPETMKEQSRYFAARHTPEDFEDEDDSTSIIFEQSAEQGTPGTTPGKKQERKQTEQDHKETVREVPLFREDAPRKRDRRPVRIAMAVSGMVPNVSGPAALGVMMDVPQFDATVLNGGYAQLFDVTKGTYTNGAPKLSSTNYSWSISYRAGLLVKVPVWNNLYVASGIQASVMSGHNDIDPKLMRLHYLGIPVQAEYLICSGKALGFSASAGARADFLVSSPSELSLPLFQPSATLGINMNYQLTSHVGLSVGAGADWYFPMADGVPFSRTTAIMNVNGGLYFTL